MSEISDAKPHRRGGNGYSIAFWRDNTASNEESATQAVVYTGTPGMPYPELQFSLPEDSYRMQTLERMLEKVFAAGVAHARQEIREALGIKR